MVRLNSNLFKKILDALPNNIYFKDKDGRYVWLNQSCVRSLSSQHRITSSTVDKTDFEVFPPQHATACVKNDKLVMDTRVGVVVEEDVLLPTGEHLTQLSFKEPLIDEETDQVLGIVGYNIDISDRKRIEKELLEAKETAEVANKAKQQFSGILGIVDHLCRNETDVDKKNMLNMLHQATNELLGYMNEMLELTQIEEVMAPVVTHDAELSVSQNSSFQGKPTTPPNSKSPILRRPLSPRILFVEDSVMVKMGCVPILESFNATVDAVDSGEEALEYLKLQDYDMVFMDIGLPGIDGYETARRMRAMDKGKAIPIIAVTAHSMDDVVSKARTVGMNNAIQKPLTPEDALTFFNTYLYDKGYLINEDVVPKKVQDPNKHIFDLTKSLVKLGTEQSVNNYLRSLNAYLPDSLSLLTTLLHKHDRITFSKEAHKLKGAVSLIEAPDLYQSILRLNDRLKIGQTGDLFALFDAVLEAADIFREYIAPRVTQSE